MRISKLFHWLYAFLMLLPCFAVGVKCFYVVLNDNAKDSYRGEYSYNSTIQLNTNNINSIPIGIKVRNRNSFIYNTTITETNTIYNIKEFYVKLGSTEYTNNSFTNYTYFAIQFYFVNSYQQGTLYIFKDNAPITTLNWQTASNINNINNKDLICEFVYNNEVHFNSGVNNLFLSNFVYNDYIIDTTLSSVFYSSLQELDKTSFFSWAKDSFVAQPMLYIGQMFGLNQVHPIFTFMSYWCAISIIWLCFDVLMYVPLLIHRYLDKGIIE